MPRKSNRRDFLKTSAVAGMGYWVSGTQSVFAQSRMKNGKINVASIGCGGQGGGDIRNIAKCGANVVALCDVDWAMAAGAFKDFPKAARFYDFREMFDKMGKEIDAVQISTPDHTHAPATMLAMKLGKHVYTQKPLTHDVYEARVLTEAARKYKVVTQMGNQGSAEPGLREACEVVWSGAIGAVREVHVWTNRPIWPQGARAIVNLPRVRAALSGNGDPNPEVPKTFNWDLWLGTAPERPFPGYKTIMPFSWRGWVDYGTGALGDMACHTANMAFRACKLGYPTSVEAEMSEAWNCETYPTWSIVKYEFPEREGLPPLQWTWYDGGRDKPSWVTAKLKELAGLGPNDKLADSGSLLIGEKGVLFSPNDYGAQYFLLPKEKFADYKPPTPTLPRHPEEWAEKKVHPHFMEWVTACEQNKPDLPFSNFSYAGPLTETVLLGCVAMRAGKRIEWDGPNLKITNIPEANAFLKREYRKGWEDLVV